MTLTHRREDLKEFRGGWVRALRVCMSACLLFWCSDVLRGCVGVILIPYSTKTMDKVREWLSQKSHSFGAIWYGLFLLNLWRLLKEAVGVGGPRKCSGLFWWGRSFTFITECFFLELTYPHHRVEFKRAAIKDPKRVLDLTLTPQVCSFRATCSWLV